MDHDLTARLPPPHEEEPASLRSDIVDELRDHLVCASDRERRRLEVSGHVADTQQVKQAVVERFGDPASVARQLWFDAMKGRIMVQRIMLGTVLAAILAMLVWIANLSRTLTSVVDENRKATAAILDRLGKEKPSEFVPARVTLVHANRGGPVVDQAVILEGLHGKAEGAGEYIRKTDHQGIADFGYLPWGVYRLMIHTDDATLRENNSTVLINSPFEPRITVPGPRETSVVRFEVKTPDWKDWKWVSPFNGPQMPYGPDPEQTYLAVRYQVVQRFPIEGRVWQTDSSTRLVVLHGQRIYQDVIEDETQFDPHSELFVNPQNPVESIIVPEGQLEVAAEWYYAKSAELDSTGRRVLVPVNTRLHDDFVASEVDRIKRGVRRKEFPLKVAVQPGKEVQLTIPGDHPDTIDGLEMPPLFPPVGGGGGIF